MYVSAGYDRIWIWVNHWDVTTNHAQPFFWDIIDVMIVSKKVNMFQ